MKALVWDDGMGESFETVDIPAELADDAETGATSSSTSSASTTRTCSRSTSARRRSPPTTCATALRAATISGDVVPVLCGTAFKNKGVQPLLDAVVDYLPSPVDVAGDPGHRRQAENELERKADDSEPFAALAFKIMSDPYVGKLTYFRVYSGKLAAGSLGAQRHQGQEGAHRPPPPDARQPPGGQGSRLRRRHRRRGRPQEHHHR